MNYENIKTFKELAELIKKHFFSDKTGVEGEVNMSPSALNEVIERRSIGAIDVTTLTYARLAYVRLKTEGRRDDLPRETPTDPIDLLSLCESAAQDKADPKTDATTKQPITLKSFIQIYCDLTRKPVIESKVTLLQEYNKGKKIKLPKLAREYKKGRANYYFVEELKKNWPQYQMEMPTLPPLKLPGN